MRITSLDDVVKLHQELTETLAKSLQPRKKQAVVSLEQLIAAKRTLHRETEAAVAVLERTKDAAIRRLDLKLQRQRERLARLEQEIAQVERAASPKVADGERPKRAKPGGKRGRGPG